MVFFLFHLVDVDVKWCGMNGFEFMSLLDSSSFYILTDRRISLHSQAEMGERIPLWCRCAVGLCSFKTSFAGGRDGSIVGRVRGSVGIACQDGEAQATAGHIDLGIQTDPDSQAEVLDYFGMFHSGFWFEGMGNHRSGQKWRWLVRALNIKWLDIRQVRLLRTSDCKTCVSCPLHSWSTSEEVSGNVCCDSLASSTSNAPSKLHWFHTALGTACVADSGFGGGTSVTWYATLDQNFIRQLLVQYVHNRSIQI